MVNLCKYMISVLVVGVSFLYSDMMVLFVSFIQVKRNSYPGHAPRSDEDGLNIFQLTIVKRKYPQGMMLNG